MMAAFDETRVQVEVEDVVIGGSESEEDAGEVVAIQLSSSVAATLDAHTRTEHLKMRQVRLHPEIPFERSGLRFAMDQTIVKVDGV